MTANDTVLLTRDGAIATLVLNRPDALNALDFAMIDALVARTAEVASDDTVHVVVLTGAGKHFMAGGDIRIFAQSLEADAAARAKTFQAMADRVHAAIESIARMPQPVIARARGAVAGFGLSLMNACDLVFAADDAYFASAYLTLGVTPDGGGTYSLPRIVGARKAAEIMLLGERLFAPQALALGLVNRVLPTADLDAAVAAAAGKLAQGPQRAVRGVKRLLRGSSGATLSEQLALEAASFGACAGADDFAEGVRAFLAKRPPSFGGGTP
jgi:2-(1,2-epoxy-1,2-dihydrophenyl)acetyl-CoA isomerase